MSLANRPTTRAEEELLLQNGFFRSPFESTGDYVEVEGERLYRGNWFHSEFRHPDRGHFGPDEALAILRERLAEHAKNNPDDT